MEKLGPQIFSHLHITIVMMMITIVTMMMQNVIGGKKIIGLITHNLSYQNCGKKVLK